jgi:hypothetical protein
MSGSRLTQMAVGDNSVWGINSAHAVYQYSFGAQKFVRVPGAFKQIAVGSSEVWGIDVSDQVYRYTAGTFTNNPRLSRARAWARAIRLYRCPRQKSN